MCAESTATPVERNWEERWLWREGEDPRRHGPSAEDCDEPEECTCAPGVARCERPPAPSRDACADCGRRTRGTRCPRCAEAAFDRGLDQYMDDAARAEDRRLSEDPPIDPEQVPR